MTYAIPSPKRAKDMGPILTQHDLCEAWRAFMGELGFGQRQIWLIFLDAEGRIMPAVSKIEHVPRRPEQEVVDKLVEMVGRIVGTGPPGSTFAMLLARPGGKRTTASDRDWAQAVRISADQSHVPMWPIHLANDHDLRAFTPDELLAVTA